MTNYNKHWNTILMDFSCKGNPSEIVMRGVPCFHVYYIVLYLNPTNIENVYDIQLIH